MQVPELDHSVVPASGEPSPIGTDLECMYRSPMRLLRPDAYSTFDLPPADSSITASTEEYLSTWDSKRQHKLDLDVL